MPEITVNQAIADAIAEEMRRDPRVVMFGEGVATKRRELVEEFDDFRAVDGLTLPHTYKLQLSASGTGSSFGGAAPGLRDWTLTVDQVSHKAAVDESVFKLR